MADVLFYGGCTLVFGGGFAFWAWLIWTMPSYVVGCADIEGSKRDDKGYDAGRHADWHAGQGW